MLFKRINLVFAGYFISSLGAGFTFAQDSTKTHVKKEFDKFDKAYYLKQLTKKNYLKAIDSLANTFLTKGIYLETKELTNHLSLYESIVWEDDKFKSARYTYYLKFLNNARIFGKQGASIYYAEKMSEQAKEDGDEHPLIEMLQKFDIYIGQGLNDKIINSYEKEEKYMQQLPSLLRNNKVKVSQGMNSIYILYPAVTAYIKTNNKFKAEKTAQLANRIGEVIKRRKDSSKEILLNTDLFLTSIPFAIALETKDNKQMGVLLQKLEKLKTKYNDINTTYVDVNLLKWRLHYFLQTHNADSLSFYIKEMEKYPASNNMQKAHILAYKGDVQALRSNFKESYNLLHESIELYQKAVSDIAIEMDTLLYAHTEAEHHQIALQKSEKVKQQRTTWLVLISGIALAIIVGIYLLMQKKSKRSQQIIDSLNDSANIQIALMEEARDQARRDEQHRLSQELHDGLSGTLASIINRLEIQVSPTDSEYLDNVRQLKKMAQQVYTEIRERSHTLNDQANSISEERFQQHIIDLARTAFPKSQYHYEVTIDQGSLNQTNFELRSHLIRIVQEAFANILKHAKATSLSVLLYHEDSLLTLSIQDNGLGMKSTSTKGIGLQNIENRVKEMNGKLDVTSSAEGTLLTCTFPIAPENN